MICDMRNLYRRHEVPVTSDPIEVVHMDEDLVVVNKPASIPVSFIYIFNHQPSLRKQNYTKIYVFIHLYYRFIDNFFR